MEYLKTNGFISSDLNPSIFSIRPKWQNSERYLIEVWDELHWRTTVKMRRMCLVSVMEVLMLINISCEIETVLRYIYLMLTLHYVHYTRR